MNLSLVEAFASVQGEGHHAGRAAVFIRFSGCNLSCVFADGAVCDTPYMQSNIKTTVDELFDELIPKLTNTNILERLGPQDKRPMLILTGGEPTLAPAFDEVVQRGRDANFYVAIETNGTRWREGLALANWVTVSPKVWVRQGSPAPFHNHNPQDSVMNADVVKFLARWSHIASGEYRWVIGPYDDAPPANIAYRNYLSPAVLSNGLGKETETGFPGFVPGAVERCLLIQRECSLVGWRISTQQHKFLRVR